MKRAILPIGIPILFVVIVRFFINPNMDMGAVLILFLMGMVTGVAINSLIFKDANAVKEVKDAKEESDHVADPAAH